MGSRLLMAHQDMFQSVLPVQGVINVQHRATGIAEDVFNALVREETGQNFRTSQFHVKTLFLFRPVIPGKTRKAIYRKKNMGPLLKNARKTGDFLKTGLRGQNYWEALFRSSGLGVSGRYTSTHEGGFAA